MSNGSNLLLGSALIACSLAVLDASQGNVGSAIADLLWAGFMATVMTIDLYHQPRRRPRR